MTQSRSSLPSREEQVTVSEALTMIKIGRSTLYRLLKEGKIPSARGAGPIRIHLDVVRKLAPGP